MSEPKCDHCGLDYCIHTVERQLAKAQAEIVRLGNQRKELDLILQYHDTIYKEAQATIERMRPVVEAAVGLYKSNSGISSMKFFQAVREYEAKEKP
jgi:predicted ATP-binding protein involved in virulence